MWEAYKRVAANKGAAGVDRMSLEDFETDLRGNLYTIWVRMSSGTYFPPPVRAVEIPKPHGGTRILGVPTVADRVAQTVVALQLEPRTESIFHCDSYGYRPGKSAHDALRKCRQRCWESNWVVDLDIQKFFDTLDHELVLKAVAANTTDRWVMLYVKRWLKAPLQLPDGAVKERDCGTPQGSAVSPVLANLVLHYAMDLWLEREFPAVSFERYADDGVLHCATEHQAQKVRDALAERLESLGLRLHPGKTKIVLCKDDNRRGSYEHTSFTFLGYEFRARSAQSRNGQLFTTFSPAVSPDALKAMSRKVRGWRIHKRSNVDLADLAKWINPIVRGWMNYYGRFNKSRLQRLLQRINAYIVRWARNKYQRLGAFKKAKRWWRGLIDREPALFAHWRWVTTF
ncbi:MAG: group II intron reverse transcriptase/maturase [Pseudonocardiaceae bacterium]